MKMVVEGEVFVEYDSQDLNATRLFDHLAIHCDRELLDQRVSLPFFIGCQQQRGLVLCQADLIGSEPVLNGGRILLELGNNNLRLLLNNGVVKIIGKNVDVAMDSRGRQVYDSDAKEERG